MRKLVTGSCIALLLVAIAAVSASSQTMPYSPFTNAIVSGGGGSIPDPLTLAVGLIVPYVTGSTSAAGQLLLQSTTDASKGCIHIEGTTNGHGATFCHTPDPIGYDDAVVLGHGSATDRTQASGASWIAQALYSGNYAAQWVMIDGQNSRIVVRQDLEMKWTNSNDRDGDTAASIGQYNAGALGVKASGGVGGSWILNPGTAPSSPIEGQMYYNAASHVVCNWNGTAWKKFDGTTACP